MKKESCSEEDILSGNIVRVLLGSLRPGRLLASRRDPWVWAMVFAGAVGLFWSPKGNAPQPSFILLAALIEETAFRACLQDCAEAWFKERRAGEGFLRSGLLSVLPSRGNLAVSVLFAASHIFAQSPLMAALTFVPSLGLGILWTRHRSLWLCSLVHAWYNFLFWYC